MKNNLKYRQTFIIRYLGLKCKKKCGFLLAFPFFVSYNTRLMEGIFFMKYMRQMSLILAFSLMGELLRAILPLPIPTAVYGILLLFAALCFGIVRDEQISDTAQFLVSILPVFFVAPIVNLLDTGHAIADYVLVLVLIVSASTALTFVVSGRIVQRLQKLFSKENGSRDTK